MGVIKTITFDSFPKQNTGSFGVGTKVSVCYHYDTNKTHEGTIVRADVEEPFETIIKLDNGRFLRSTECQYWPIDYTEIYKQTDLPAWAKAEYYAGI